MRHVFRICTYAITAITLAVGLDVCLAGEAATVSPPRDLLTDDLDKKIDEPTPVSEMPTCKPSLDKPTLRISSLPPLQAPGQLPPIPVEKVLKTSNSHSVNAAQGGFQIDFPNLVVPIRQPTSSSDVTQLLRSKSNYKSLKEQRDYIRNVIASRNYNVAKYYVINNGFAILLPYEMVDENGYPLPGNSRWVLGKRPCSDFYTFNLGLWQGVYGRFRAIAIIVSDELPIQNLKIETKRLIAVDQIPDIAAPPKRVFVAVYEGNINNRGEVSHLKQSALQVENHIRSLF